MKNKKIDLDKELEKCSTMEDLIGKDGLLQRLVGGMIENLLEREMEEHLGYSKHDSEGHNSGNSRNGKTVKTVQSSYGPLELHVPRDRNASFEPKLVKKRQCAITSFDEKIISMYARGMSTRDIQGHIKEIYGAEISPTAISHITDKVMELVAEWQSRTLSAVYPIVYFDAIHFKVRDGSRVITKAAYTCLGIDTEGKKDILGLWIGESEGAKFWLGVFTELQNRGVEDILIACVDGLKGLPEAINTVFPKAEVQLCIIHMIRNSLKYVPSKHSKEFVADLKEIYRAVTEESAERGLLNLRSKWEDKYHLAVNPWVNNWENIKVFFKFPAIIRRIIYTTNAVESLHRQFRKVTKTKAVFPSDNALRKMLFLAIRGLSDKWTSTVHGWTEALSYFSLMYGDRLKLEVSV